MSGDQQERSNRLIVPRWSCTDHCILTGAFTARLVLCRRHFVRLFLFFFFFLVLAVRPRCARCLSVCPSFCVCQSLSRPPSSSSSSTSRRLVSVVAAAVSSLLPVTQTKLTRSSTESVSLSLSLCKEANLCCLFTALTLSSQHICNYEAS